MFSMWQEGSGTEVEEVGVLSYHSLWTAKVSSPEEEEMAEQTTKKGSSTKSEQPIKKTAAKDLKNEELEEKTDEVLEDIDGLIDEIDSLLEEDCQKFVANYIQRGGE